MSARAGSVRCPSDGELRGLSDGSLEEARAAEVADHLEGCETCLERIAQLDETGRPLPLAAVAPGGPASSRRKAEALIDSIRPLLQPPEAETLRKSLAPSRERYRLLQKLGAGGMGEVHLAHDQRLDRKVALKLVDGHADDADKLGRFMAEARITGRLDHPGVVPVYDLGELTERAFFAMQRVAGEDLDRVLGEIREQARPYRLPELLGIFAKICDAVAYAHSRGVIHRDLKPANVRVGRFGEVYVMDWGLAKVVGEDVEATAPHARQRPLLESATGTPMTTYGSVMGTPAYMSPEQACGDIDSLGVHSDVYSLGAMLYEMLSLEPPYSGTPREVIDQIVSGARPLPVSQRTQRPVPRALEAITMRAMAADPASRYSDVESLRADLDRFIEGGIARTLVDSWVSILPYLALAAAAAAGAAIGELVRWL